MNLNDFTANILEVWESLDQSDLLGEVEIALISNATSAIDWQDSNCKNRAGIYCFWYSGIEHKYDAFKYQYEKIVKSVNYKFSKSYSKWYNHQDIYRTDIKHMSLNNVRSFYLGKREEVKKRISEHIKAGSPSTYGLHLNRVPDLIKDLSIGYWNIPIEIEQALDSNPKYGKYIKQQLLVYIESEMRKKLTPMVGKQ
jgi:hypothetical protein